MNENNVKGYFDKIVDEFDNIYENKGTLFTKLTNKIFRKSMKERVPLTIKECGDLNNKTVLDIGCGSGRISFLLAKENAKVTGLDYSKNMIDLAKKYQIQLKQTSNTEFICCDFLHDFTTKQKYDISIAIGFFDYVHDPIVILKKIKSVTNNKFIASYPAKFSLNTPLRKIWLKSRNCPVFFYTTKNIKKIYTKAGMKIINIISLPRDSLLPTSYLVIAELN